MTGEVTRSVAHAGFTLVREYPVPVQEVWEAFADPERKKEWFGDGEAWSLGEWRHDFRVGGRDVADAEFHGGPRSRYEATYTDIVDRNRIVITYDMSIDGRHISTSVASFEFESVVDGTRFTHVEHGVHLDGFDDGTLREEGTRGVLDALGEYLTRDR